MAVWRAFTFPAADANLRVLRCGRHMGLGAYHSAVRDTLEELSLNCISYRACLETIFMFVVAAAAAVRTVLIVHAVCVAVAAACTGVRRSIVTVTITAAIAAFAVAARGRRV